MVGTIYPEDDGLSRLFATSLPSFHASVFRSVTMPSPAVAEIVLLSGRTATGQAQPPCGGRINSSLPKAHDLDPIRQAPEMAGLAEALEIGGYLLGKVGGAR